MEKIYGNRKILFVMLLLLVAVVLTFNASWARYYESLEGDIEIKASDFQTFYLWGIQDGVLTSEMDIQSTEETTTLELAVSNGVEDEYYGETDVIVEPQLYVSENIGGSSNLSVSFILEQDGTSKTYSSKASEIQEATNLYYSFGAGWVYQFYDDDGEILQLELLGGEYSEIQMRIVVEAKNNIEDYFLRAVMIEN